MPPHCRDSPHLLPHSGFPNGMLFDQGLENHLQLEKNTMLPLQAASSWYQAPFIHLGGCGLIKDGSLW